MQLVNCGIMLQNQTLTPTLTVTPTQGCEVPQCQLLQLHVIPSQPLPFSLVYCHLLFFCSTYLWKKGGMRTAWVLRWGVGCSFSHQNFLTQLQHDFVTSNEHISAIFLNKSLFPRNISNGNKKLAGEWEKWWMIISAGITCSMRVTLPANSVSNLTSVLLKSVFIFTVNW